MPTDRPTDRLVGRGRGQLGPRDSNQKPGSVVLLIVYVYGGSAHRLPVYDNLSCVPSGFTRLYEFFFFHGAQRIRFLRFTKFCWVGKHVNIDMKPTNPPTQGQLNPRKLGLKWHLDHFFPHQIFFRGLGLVVYRKQTTRNLTQPNSPQTP